MFSRTTDTDIFRQFWKDEQANEPEFFKAASKAWTETEEDFLAFCNRCDRIYLIDDVALLYVERANTHANIHFSVIRGQKVKTEDLLAIRAELFKDFTAIFGWCPRKNWGLKKILKACGFSYYGFSMLHGFYRGRPLEWDCFAVSSY